MRYFDTIRRIRTGDYRKSTDEERDAAVKEVVEMAALASAALVLQPIPGLEQGVLPVQIAMVLTIAHVYGRELNRKEATDILMDIAKICGAAFLSRMILTTVSKMLLPFLGGAISAPYTFSMTWAVGYATKHYFVMGGRVDKAKLKDIFEAEQKRSKSFYSEDKARSARPDKADLQS